MNSLSSLKRCMALLGLTLPPVNGTSYSYQPALRVGDTLYLAGQIPKVSADAVLHTGRLGVDVGFEAAAECVSCCMLNALAGSHSFLPDAW